MGIRLRTTLTTTLIAALALIAGALLFVDATRNRIETAITEDARDRSTEIANAVAANQLSPVLVVGDPELVAQVVDSSGQVVSSDQIIVGLPPLVATEDTGPEMETERVEGLDARLDDIGPFVVVKHRLDLDSGSLVIIVVGSLGDAGEALEAVTPLLVAGVPVWLALVGALTWIMTGRALRPVERIGAEAHNISVSALHRRVPVPESKDEIHRLAKTINEMLERLEASVRQQRQFISDSSHELKSPLATLKTILDVAERGNEPASSETLTDMRAEMDRLEHLVEDLLYLAAVDEGRPQRRPDDLDLVQVVAEEVASVNRRTGLTIDASALVPMRVRGDRHDLTLLVRNLLDNAVRFAATGVWIETIEQDGFAFLVISDDGPGIPPPDRKRVFERFVRLDEGRDRQSGGTGLGLAVADAIASTHGGDLGLIESLHGGASFQVRLPKTQLPS